METKHGALETIWNMASSDRLTQLTYEASRLRPLRLSPDVLVSRNGRFYASRNRYAVQGRARLWTMTDRRGGKVYSTHTDSLVGHYKEIRSIIAFEGRCLADGDRPAAMPA